MNRFVLVVTLVLASTLSAQEPVTPARPDTAEAERLRAQIEERFSQRVQEELRLTPDQSAKLRASQEKFGGQRRTLVRQQMERRRALDDQMQPGVAANADSVKRLMDANQNARAQMLKLEQDEDREMATYLTPVQRARYQQMREGLMRRVMEMRAQRRGGAGGGRMGPGMGQGGRRPGGAGARPRRPRGRGI
ncbi:MAG TPA: Spy/CpxP family protein refolding chaperone [Gemmatimonadales bacterium]|jgi:Spy/CpxP family protein refolding chaperone|nr:Spy/CpxP family protein refolding chaperone [Gemmatimonadales bacterium]